MSLKNFQLISYSQVKTEKDQFLKHCLQHLPETQH